MKKSVLSLVFAVILAAAGCSGGYIHVRISPDLNADKFSCIAVAPFDNLSLTSRSGLMVADMVSASLARETGSAVVDPRSFLTFADQRKLDTANLSSQTLLQNLRTEWGATLLVRGKVKEYWYTDDPEVYSDKQPAVAFRVEIVDTETGEVLFDSDFAGTRSGFKPGVGSLSEVALHGIDEAFRPLFRQIGNEGRRMYPECTFNNPAFAARPAETVRRQEVDQKQEPEPAVFPDPQIDTGGSLSADALDLLEQLKGGSRTILRSLQFEYGNSVFKESGQLLMLSLVDVMRKYPDLEVAIWIHTDNSLGTDESEELTRRQADAILNYLRDQGQISPSRLQLHAVGSAEPILPNINRRNRMVNRRVEIQTLVPPLQGW